MRKVLLASEGREFSADAIRFASEIVDGRKGRVRVVTIARLWGTRFGLPHPGLRPNKQEMKVHQDNVSMAIGELKKRGVAADGHIITTRKPSRSIVNEAERQGCDAIVMGADHRRAWLIADMMWSQEPYRVRRQANVPVHLTGAD